MPAAAKPLRMSDRYCSFLLFHVGMGIPYRKEGISLLSIAVDAPMDKINAITGKLGAIAGVSAKTVYPQKNC